MRLREVPRIVRRTRDLTIAQFDASGAGRRGSERVKIRDSPTRVVSLIFFRIFKTLAVRSLITARTKTSHIRNGLFSQNVAPFLIFSPRFPFPRNREKLLFSYL